MKNQLYFQKQKINWNKNVKQYVKNSNFKQTRSYNKKEKPQKDYFDDFDIPYKVKESFKIPINSTLAKILIPILILNSNLLENENYIENEIDTTENQIESKKTDLKLIETKDNDFKPKI